MTLEGETLGGYKALMPYSQLPFALILSLPSQVILACLAAVAVAAPQFARDIPRPVIQVLRYNSADDGNGNFNYEFETENGIYKNVQGSPGSLGQSNMRGVFR